MTDDALPAYPMPRDLRCPLDLPTAYRQLRQGPPIRVRIWDGSTPWLLTRYDDVLQALSDRRITMEIRRPGFPHTSPSSAARAASEPLAYPFRAPPEHLAQGAMLMAELTPRRLEALRPKIQHVVDDAIDRLLAGPAPADFVHDFALPVAILCICDLLGMPRADGVFLHASSKIVGSRTAPKDNVVAAFTELQRYFARLVADAERAPGDDLIGRLVTERIRTGALTAADAVSMVESLYFAGHGPVGYSIVMGTVALLANPAQFAALATMDSAAVAAAIEELMRFVTVSHNARQRVAVEDTVVGGQPIRAGEGVLIQIDSANRDETAFADPDRLDLARPPRRHFALGHGVHICLGRALAQIELQIVFASLARRMPSLRLAAPLAEIPFKDDENLLGAHALPVTWG
jgi:cytochrome P450